MMRLRVKYPQSEAEFEVEANDIDDLELLMNTALKILWPKTTHGMSFEEVDKMIGWTPPFERGGKESK